MARFSPRRFSVWLRRTSLFDRVAVAVVILDAIEGLVPHLGFRKLPFSSFISFLGFAAIVYLAVRLILWVRLRALWGLRNRLIVAYVFMAVIPVALLLTMVGVSFILLELQIGAHLLRDDLGRHLTVIAADRNAIAAALRHEPGLKVDEPVSPNSSATADPALLRPGVASVIAAAQAEWPDLSVYLNHGQQLVRTPKTCPDSCLDRISRAALVRVGRRAARTGRPCHRAGNCACHAALLNSLPSKLGPIELTCSTRQPIPLVIRARSNLGNLDTFWGSELPAAAEPLVLLPIGSIFLWMA